MDTLYYHQNTEKPADDPHGTSFHASDLVLAGTLPLT